MNFSVLLTASVLGQGEHEPKLILALWFALMAFISSFVTDTLVPMLPALLTFLGAFITQLPDGYDTVIEDQGIRLSGGQRQRISLARTLLKDPPILILDEATAMFDPEGEKAFIAECREMLGRKTVILITHRPASLALADRTIRLES